VESSIREKHMVAFALRGADRFDPTVYILVRPAVDFEEALARAVVQDLGGFNVTFASRRVPGASGTRLTSTRCGAS
jgi:hypothetical protein